MILTWHNDASYNILVLQNTKKHVSRFFLNSHTQKFQVCRFEDFFHKLYPSYPQGDGRPFYLWRVEKEHLRVQLQWLQEMPGGRIFYFGDTGVAVEGWLFITSQLVSFQASCRGERTAVNSTIQTPNFLSLELI